jgi:hypothetical protein
VFATDPEDCREIFSFSSQVGLIHAGLLGNLASKSCPFARDCRSPVHFGPRSFPRRLSTMGDKAPKDKAKQKKIDTKKKTAASKPAAEAKSGKK